MDTRVVVVRWRQSGAALVSFFPRGTPGVRAGVTSTSLCDTSDIRSTKRRPGAILDMYC